MPKAPLKVGLVLDDGLDVPDGVQQYILTIGEWLKGEGHSVRYLVGETKRTDIGGAISLSRNIGVISNGNRLSMPLPTSRRRLKKLLAKEQFDVLHVQTPYSPFMGEQLIRLAGPKTAVIGTFHILPASWIFGLGTKLLGLWSWWSLRRFDAMLSVSSAAQAFAKQTYSIDSTVLPNVVDYTRFHKAAPLPQYNDAVLTILFLGRLVPRKGCKLLLEAIYELKQSGADLPKFRVVICGKGPLQAALETYVQQHGLSSIVEFVGFVREEDKPSYYASADIAVFPSNGGESFGIVLLEAMASGKAAVLAGDNPGYRSVMDPQPDLLFDPTNASSLANKLQEMLTNTAERAKMAQWGAQYTKDFDTAVIGQKLLTIYQEALRKRGKL